VASFFDGFLQSAGPIDDTGDVEFVINKDVVMEIRVREWGPSTECGMHQELLEAGLARQVVYLLPKFRNCRPPESPLFNLFRKTYT
jgi:hypothetical protein